MIQLKYIKDIETNIQAIASDVADTFKGQLRHRPNGATVSFSSFGGEEKWLNINIYDTPTFKEPHIFHRGSSEAYDFAKRHEANVLFQDVPLAFSCNQAQIVMAKHNKPFRVILNDSSEVVDIQRLSLSWDEICHVAYTEIGQLIWKDFNGVVRWNGNQSRLPYIPKDSDLPWIDEEGYHAAMISEGHTPIEGGRWI